MLSNLFGQVKFSLVTVCSGIPGSQPEPVGGLCECVSAAVRRYERGRVIFLSSSLSTLLPGGVSQFLFDIFSSSAYFSNKGSVIAFTSSTVCHMCLSTLDLPWSVASSLCYLGGKRLCKGCLSIFLARYC